eukprot:5337496-Pyramimonas_sp.AAC.1
MSKLAPLLHCVRRMQPWRTLGAGPQEIGSVDVLQGVLKVQFKQHVTALGFSSLTKPFRCGELGLPVKLVLTRNTRASTRTNASKYRTSFLR